MQSRPDTTAVEPASPSHWHGRTRPAVTPNLVPHVRAAGVASQHMTSTASAGSLVPLGSYVRIGFGVIWAVDAAMKWAPAFHFMDVVRHGAGSQPSWLDPWYRFWESVLGTRPDAFAFGVAILESVIAVALLVGFARLSTYLLGILWSLGIWAVPEGFGNDDRAMSTDIGTGIIYALVFLALLALDQYFGTRCWSADAVIERRLPWWRRVAEIRR